MDFFLQKETKRLPPKKSPFSIEITFVTSRITQGKYQLNFICEIAIEEIGNNNIDTSLIKGKLENKIKEADKKYVKLIEGNHRRAVYEFNVEKWLKDAMSEINGKFYYGKYSKEYRLKRQIPRFISSVAYRVDLEKYIATYFKEEVSKSRKRQDEIVKGIPLTGLNHFKQNLMNVFDVKYSYINNSLSVSLKNEYVMSMLYGLQREFKKR
jgi:hypothetical protein